MTFWSSNAVEPKRSFRFLLELTPAGAANKIATYYIKTVKKPQFQMDGQAEVKYIQHTFKYPGRITWQPIDITLLDPADPDSAAIMMNIIRSSGYRIPDDEANSKESISKKKANTGMGAVIIRQINSEGVSISEWNLANPFLTNVDFGTVGYDSDDIVEYTLTVDYDYATMTSKGTTVAAGVTHTA